MKEANKIEEIFKDKLHDLETPVRADLWNNIASQAGVQTSFWSVLKIAGLSVATVFLFATIWLIWTSSSEQNEAAPLPLSKLTENVVQEIDAESATEIPEVVVQSKSIDQGTLSKSTKQSNNTITSPLNQPEPGTMTIEEWAAFLRDGRGSTDAKPTSQEAKELQDMAQKKADVPMKKETVESLNVDKDNTKSFEAAERLDLNMLIAPEKREEVSRESKHYPSAFPKFFNPNLSGDAASFSIEVRDVSFFKIEIKNQKGQLVFSSQNPNFIWKGTTLDGSMAPEGTYLFLVESNDLNGQALKPQSGAVFLMRK